MASKNVIWCIDVIFDIGKRGYVETSLKMIAYWKNANPVHIVCIEFAQLRKNTAVSMMWER